MINKSTNFALEIQLEHSFAIGSTYKKLNAQQRKDVLAYRKQQHLPLHAPPHFPDGEKTYIITAANYKHASILKSDSRKTNFERSILTLLEEELNAEIFAWCVLPNHYHLLVKIDLKQFQRSIGKFHRKFSIQWNREDHIPGRKVWYRFSDRWIRSEKHFQATINYIHANPVKHGYVKNASLWKWSSFNDYENNYGRDLLVKMWYEYPVHDFGNGWD